jgi:hypothetical protein
MEIEFIFNCVFTWKIPAQGDPKNNENFPPLHKKAIYSI